jgi:hypothetical protein
MTSNKQHSERQEVLYNPSSDSMVNQATQAPKALKSLSVQLWAILP